MMDYHIVNRSRAVYASSFLILLITGFTSKGQCKTDLQKMNVFGQVDSIREFEFTGSEKLIHICTLRFNASGNEVSRTSFHESNDFMPNQILTVFDENGIKIRENRYNSKGELERYLIYTYDEMGNHLTDSLYEIGIGLDTYSIYTYDSLCNQIEYKHCYGDGFPAIWYTYFVNDGRVVGGMDQLEYRELAYGYDKFGNRTQVRTIHNGEEVVWRYIYDKKYNWIESKEIELQADEKPYWIIRREIYYSD